MTYSYDIHVPFITIGHLKVQLYGLLFSSLHAQHNDHDQQEKNDEQHTNNYNRDDDFKWKTIIKQFSIKESVYVSADDHLCVCVCVCVLVVE